MTPYPLTESLFRTSRPTVIVAGKQGPYANTCAALAQLDLSPVRGKRVLLKPNAGRMATVGSGIVTEPQVVAAAIDVLTAAGATVAIGESPIIGVNTLEAFEHMGLTAVAQTRNCPLIDMDARPPVEFPIPEGVAIQSLGVCADVFDFDLIVSLPVMKMHMHTGVTLAVKNMKGCLWRRNKVKLHMLPPIAGHDDKPIDIAIADMSGVLRPHLSIIDGTVGMEGMGPSAGQPKPLDVIVVSGDAFAADAVACALMGARAEDIPHLRMGAARGYGVIDLANIAVIPEQWRDWTNPFCPPPQNLSIAFPNITILDRNSCSACQSTLMLLLKHYGARVFDYFPTDVHPHIAIGKGHETLPVGTLCIGNCTLRHREVGLFIPGCPPVSSQILTALSGKVCVDTEDRGA